MCNTASQKVQSSTPSLEPVSSADLSFENTDFLDRSTIANDIFELLSIFDKSVLRHGAYSIAIDGKWGTGKTHFVKMFINKIKNERPDDKVVYYDAWEHDDSDSTLLPLLYSIMSEALDKDNEKYISSITTFFKIFATTAAKIGTIKLFGIESDAINTIIGDAIGEATKTEGDDDRSSKIAALFDEYEKMYDRRNTLNELLTDLVGQNKRLWVFIDDLDRCKPGFALETLEDIKHFFDIKGIVFVFSTDIKQFSNTIKHTYGIEKEKESYVRKFFDYIYLFPSPNYSKYLEKMMNAKKFNIDNTEIKNQIVNLYTHFDFSLREINQNISHLQVFIESNKENINAAIKNGDLSGLKIYLYFLAIRDKYPSMYSSIIKGKFSLTQGNQVLNYYEEYYTFNKFIKSFLECIQEYKIVEAEDCARVIRQNGLFINVENNNFLKHMQLVLK